MHKRSEIRNSDYINYLKGNYKNIKFAGLDINEERRYIYTADNDFYKFHHINDVPWDAWGNLLESEEVRSLKRLNREKLPVDCNLIDLRSTNDGN